MLRIKLKYKLLVLCAALQPDDNADQRATLQTEVSGSIWLGDNMYAGCKRPAV